MKNKKNKKKNLRKPSTTTTFVFVSLTVNIFPRQPVRKVREKCEITLGDDRGGGGHRKTPLFGPSCNSPKSKLTVRCNRSKRAGLCVWRQQTISQHTHNTHVGNGAQFSRLVMISFRSAGLEGRSRRPTQCTVQKNFKELYVLWSRCLTRLIDQHFFGGEFLFSSTNTQTPIRQGIGRW